MYICALFVCMFAYTNCVYAVYIPYYVHTYIHKHARTGTITRHVHAQTQILPAFQYIEINGQRLPEPSSLYSVLLQGLTGRKAAGTLAAQQLDAYFGSKQSAKQDCWCVCMFVCVFWCMSCVCVCVCVCVWKHTHQLSV